MPKNHDQHIPLTPETLPTLVAEAKALGPKYVEVLKEQVLRQTSPEMALVGELFDGLVKQV